MQGIKTKFSLDMLQEGSGYLSTEDVREAMFLIGGLRTVDKKMYYYELLMPRISQVSDMKMYNLAARKSRALAPPPE